MGGQGVGTVHGFAIGWQAGARPTTALSSTWAYNGSRYYVAFETTWGVGQSTYRAIDGSFTWSDMFGFAPLAGWGARGGEFHLPFGTNARVTPFGNRTGHPYGRTALPPSYTRSEPTRPLAGKSESSATSPMGTQAR
jgi:hypothetical protein